MHIFCRTLIVQKPVENWKMEVILRNSMFKFDFRLLTVGWIRMGATS